MRFCIGFLFQFLNGALFTGLLFRIGFRNKVAVLLQGTYSAFERGRASLADWNSRLTGKSRGSQFAVAEPIVYPTAKIETSATKAS